MEKQKVVLEGKKTDFLAKFGIKSLKLSRGLKATSKTKFIYKFVPWHFEFVSFYVRFDKREKVCRVP
jgi:hypothetical protein